MKNLLLSINAMVSSHLMKKADILKEKYYINNLETQGVELSMNHDIPVILLLVGQRFWTIHSKKNIFKTIL